MRPVMMAALLLGAAALGAMPADAAKVTDGETAIVLRQTAVRGDAAVAAMDGKAITLACVDGGCVGTPAACQAASAALGGACMNGEDRCRADWFRYQTWEVEGQHGGKGAVQFYTQCGEDKVSVCETVDLPHCQSEKPGAGEGELGCFYVILHGSPTDIVGRCIDPVDPSLAYEAVPAGTPFVAAERLLPA